MTWSKKPSHALSTLYKACTSACPPQENSLEMEDYSVVTNFW